MPIEDARLEGDTEERERLSLEDAREDPFSEKGGQEAQSSLQPPKSSSITFTPAKPGPAVPPANPRSLEVQSEGDEINSGDELRQNREEARRAPPPSATTGKGRGGDTTWPEGHVSCCPYSNGHSRCWNVPAVY